VPWTSSKITGSPEPPPPARAVRAYPKLTFTKPVHLVPFPDGRRWVAIEEKAMLYSFPASEDVAKPDLLIDLRKELRGIEAIPDAKQVDNCYAIAFDPDFARNRFCYVMYVLRSVDGRKKLPGGSRVSRFKVTDADPPRIDPASESLLIDWVNGGHNGCDLQFGNDGMLYVSTGDAEDPSPPDKRRTGQDCSDLLSSILRLDVRGGALKVPPDNPFVGMKGIRPEIWAYGFRNPWRMSFDRATGRLWAGDVGWERWELVFCVEKGGNYGWSVVEGPDACIPDAPRGPTPILPAAHAIPHPTAASITGGFVYRGKKLKGVEGWYVYGDWESRRVFANPVKGAALGERLDLARTPARIVAFAEEADGELLCVDYEGGGLWRLVPNDAAGSNRDFPRTLSATGLFGAVREQAPAPGVVPYAINAEPWADGATARRWVGIPNAESIRFVDKNREWPKESVWPTDSVLAKTLSVDGRKVETQVLHFDGQGWAGYAYAWNAEQTEAALAPAEGASIDLGGGRKWTIAPRAACLTCHNPWPGYALTFNAAQLDRDRQIETFQAWGILPSKIARSKKLVDPRDATAPLDERARAYLSVNCAHCHRFGGGGSARIDLRHELPLEQTQAVGVRPGLGGFDLQDPFIICAGDPARSVLLYRVSKVGQGRMPHVGSEAVDVEGVKLLADWIRSLGAPAAPRRSLSTPGEALELMLALDGLPETERAAAIRQALELPPGGIRDLFERFEAPGRRRERLGTSIKPETILSRTGDAARGATLFASAMVQCGTCHRAGPGPETLGPELSKIGAKYTRAQLLEALLEPSKTIDPKYAGVLVRTSRGDVLSGIVASRSDAELVLREAGNKETRLAAGEVERLVPQQKSLMPDGLLQHLTAQEAADLLAYLASLK
jgi:putative heme-binding domain-containing protein